MIVLTPNNVEIGSTMMILSVLSDALSSDKYDFYYSFEGIEKTLIEADYQGGRAYYWNVPSSLGNAISSGKSGSGKIYVDCKTGSTTISEETNFTAYISDSEASKPDVSMSLAPSSDLPMAFQNMYIQGKSKVQATISATAKTGATISSLTMSINGREYGTPFLSDYLSVSGQAFVLATAVDSRGFSRQIAQRIDIVSYSSPVITAYSGENKVIVGRCLADGTLSDEGTYVRIKCGKACSDVSTLNKCTLQWRYKQSSGGTYSAWATLLGENEAAIIDYNSYSSSITFAKENGYSIQLKVADSIGSETIFTTMLSSDGFALDFEPDAEAIGIGAKADSSKPHSITMGYEAFFLNGIMGTLKAESLTDILAYANGDCPVGISAIMTSTPEIGLIMKVDNNNYTVLVTNYGNSDTSQRSLKINIRKKGTNSGWKTISST